MICRKPAVGEFIFLTASRGEGNGTSGSCIRKVSWTTPRRRHHPARCGSLEEEG